jgi:hypothetical protein
MIRFAGYVLVFGAASLLADDKRPPKTPAMGNRLTLVTGLVEKGDKESLRVKIRRPDGKLAENASTLKVTPATRITVAPDLTRGMPANNAKSEDLAPGQEIEIIYAESKDGPILLTAIVYRRSD